MAIKPVKKIVPTKTAATEDTAEDVEEVEDVTSTDTAEVVEDTAPVAKKVTPKDPLTDLVQVAVHELVQPAPRVGGVCMVRDLSITQLDVGMHRIPRVVAEVLVDRRKASYVN